MEIFLNFFCFLAIWALKQIGSFSWVEFLNDVPEGGVIDEVF